MDYTAIWVMGAALAVMLAASVVIVACMVVMLVVTRLRQKKTPDA